MKYQPIDRYPGYLFGDDGSVWSNRREGWQQLQCTLNSKGYRIACLSTCCGGRYAQRQRPVHQLILEAFVGPRPDGMEACHDPDPTPSNNRLCNLRWDTHSANARDGIKHRRLRHIHAVAQEAARYNASRTPATAS